MGILERLKEIKATIFFGNTMADEYMWKAIDEIERLREALRKIADEEKDCFPIQTARDALKEKE